MEKSDIEIINGSGLFFFQSRLNNESKLRIVKWYKNLSRDEKFMVDALISEAKDEVYFFSQDNDELK